MLSHLHVICLLLLSSYDFANSNLNDEFLNKMNPHHVPDVVRISSVPYNGLKRTRKNLRMRRFVRLTRKFKSYCPLLMSSTTEKRFRLTSFSCFLNKTLLWISVMRGEPGSALQTHSDQNLPEKISEKNFFFFFFALEVWHPCLFSFRFWLRSATTGQRE